MGFQPGPWMSVYAASKAYVLHFSEGLREELKKTGVKISVLCPGPTRTAFFRTAQLEADKFTSHKMMTAEEIALYTVRALEKNRAVIIPGWRNKLVTAAPKFTTRWVTRKIWGSLLKSRMTP
jgi:short-subunit dehydrogenase